MEPESSTMAHPAAETIDQEMFKFALQFSFSLLIIRKYIAKIRWRFVVVALDVLKRWDDKLLYFLNGRSFKEDAQQGDDGRAAVGQEDIVESEELGYDDLGFWFLFVYSWSGGYHGRGFVLLFLYLWFGYCVYQRTGPIGEGHKAWIVAISCTTILWPLLNGVLDFIPWICRRMLRRYCKKSDEYMY